MMIENNNNMWQQNSFKYNRVRIHVKKYSHKYINIIFQLLINISKGLLRIGQQAGEEVEKGQLKTRAFLSFIYLFIYIN